MSDLPEHVRRNRAHWDQLAPGYVAAGERDLRDVDGVLREVDTCVIDLDVLNIDVVLCAAFRLEAEAFHRDAAYVNGQPEGAAAAREVVAAFDPYRAGVDLERQALTHVAPQRARLEVDDLEGPERRQRRQVHGTAP